MGVELSVIIPSRGQVSCLKPCLESLKGQTLPRSDYEILIVMTSSITGPVNNLLAELNLHNARVLVSEKSRVNELRNFGLQQSQGQWAFLLDDDCRVIDPDHLQARLWQQQELGPMAVLYGPYQDDPHCGYWGRAYNQITRLWQVRGNSKGAQCAHFLAGNVSWGQALGPWLFSTQLGLGGEEVELARRMQARGLRAVFDKRWAVAHHAQHSLGRFLHRAWHQGRCKAVVGSSGSRQFQALQHVLNPRPQIFIYAPALLLFFLLLCAGRYWPLEQRTA